MNLEFLSSNELKKYPFTDASDLTSDASFLLENDVLLDLLVHRKNQTDPYSVKVTSISVVPSTSVTFELSFFDREGTEIGTAISVEIPAVSIVNLQTFAIDHEDYWLKLVSGRGLVKLLTGSAITETFSTLVLVDAAVVQPSPKVTSVALYNNDVLFQTVTANQVDDIDLELEEGNNISMSTDTSGAILDVFAGYGAGLYDACSDELFISTINSIPPSNDNNFLFLADSCYTTTPLAHGLLLENHCQPKCTISHFENFVHYLNRIKDGISDVGGIANTTGDELTTQIAEYSSAFVPIKNKPYIKHAYTKFSAGGASYFYSVVVGIFNTRNEDIAYSLTVTHGGALVTDTVRWKVKDESILLATPTKTGTLSCLSVGKLEFVFGGTAGSTFTINGSLEGVAITPIVVTVT